MGVCCLMLWNMMIMRPFVEFLPCYNCFDRMLFDMSLAIVITYKITVVIEVYSYYLCKAGLYWVLGLVGQVYNDFCGVHSITLMLASTLSFLHNLGMRLLWFVRDNMIGGFKSNYSREREIFLCYAFETWGIQIQLSWRGRFSYAML